MIGSSSAWRWISVSITSGSASVKKPPPLTGGNCAGSPSTRIGLPKERRSRPSSASTIEHSSMTMRPAREAGPSWLRVKVGAPSLAFAGAVDQRVDGRGAGAALRAHHQRRLAGEGGEGRFALRRFGDVARQRRLADPGVAEQPEHLRLARLEPSPDLVERRRLLRRPLRRRSAAPSPGSAAGPGPRSLSAARRRPGSRRAPAAWPADRDRPRRRNAHK